VTVQLHLLNAGGQFDAIRSRVEDSFFDSVSTIARWLELPAVDIVVRVDANGVLPELGVGGRAESADRISVAIDPQSIHFETQFEAGFKRLLAHELHHCTRWSGPGYGRTLAEALISEGLACMFETEIDPGDPPFYARALSEGQLSELLVRAEAERMHEAYDHVAWFFGSASKGIPRHAGYSLGYELVARHIQRHRGNAALLVKTAAADFYL
jgi:uncharacterized protein YjaZ